MAANPQASPPYGTAAIHPDGTIFPADHNLPIAAVGDGLSHTIITVETLDEAASRWVFGKEATLVGLPQSSSATGTAPQPPLTYFAPPGFDGTFGPGSAVAKAGLRTFLAYDFSPGGADAGKYEDPGFGKTPPAYGPSSGHPAVVIGGMGDGSRGRSPSRSTRQRDFPDHEEQQRSFLYAVNPTQPTSSSRSQDMDINRAIRCFCGICALAAATAGKSAEPAAKAPEKAAAKAPVLSAADQKFLDGLMQQFLFDPKGAQYVRVKTTARDVWAASRTIQREGWLVPGQDGKTARVSFTDGESIAAPSQDQIEKIDFLEQCRKRYADAEKPAAKEEDNQAVFRRCAARPWDRSNSGTSRWPPGSIAWISRNWPPRR